MNTNDNLTVMQLTQSRLEKLVVSCESTISDVLSSIDKSAIGLALLVDSDGSLLHTVTDGDIRRAILAGKNVDECVTGLFEKDENGDKPSPVTAAVGISRDDARTILKSHRIRHLPLVDDQNVPRNILTLDDLLMKEDLPVQAVVMAGGFGTRLRPLTNDTPKPMLNLGDKPMLERIVRQLADVGIQDMKITTHFLPEKIREHFSDGSNFGVSIEYVDEDNPLGTAGSLGLIDKPEQPMLVLNGDILTDVNFHSMYDFHRLHEADLTVGCRQYKFDVPFGVLKCEGANILEVQEKPSYPFLVNAGIYLINPDVHDLVSRNEYLDMPDLITSVIAQGKKVVSFPILEYWSDVGQHTSYEQANLDIANGKIAA